MSLVFKCWMLKTAFESSIRPLVCSKIRFSSDSSSKSTTVSRETIELLERLSLVKIDNEVGIRRLESAIAFADQLREVDTTGVEPLYSVQESRSLYLRPDEVTEGDHCEELLGCATKTLDDCFVAPPGNIPLTEQDRQPTKDSASTVGLKTTESRTR